MMDGIIAPAHTKLAFPALSPTMERGTIASWKVKAGDKVSVGSVLGEVTPSTVLSIPFDYQIMAQ
jgi:hypothetical protein